MRYCEAVNCSNSSKEGFKMCHFPRSPNRRAKWIKSVGRDQWSPKKYSTLCEKHFSDEMWENVEKIGKKKLKQTAVPNRFNQPTISSSQNVNRMLFSKSILKVNLPNSAHEKSIELSSTPLTTISEEHVEEQTLINHRSDSSYDAIEEIEEINSEISNTNVLFDSKKMQLESSKNNEEAEKIVNLEKLVKKYKRVMKTMQTQHKKQKKLLQQRIHKLQQEVKLSQERMNEIMQTIINRN